MRIERINIKNYRQYRKLDIDFSSKKLHLIKGIMGTGKTNFLNAINWCFYKEEPYRKKESMRLPLLNLNSKDESEEGDILDISVEIWGKYKDSTIVFKRIAQCQIINKDGKKDVSLYKNPEIQVKHNLGGGSFKILEGEPAQEFVQRIVPIEIRDFFFFDGERLDRYFKEATGQNKKSGVS